MYRLLMKLGELSGCHQRPERSFFIKGYQFPLCARCTGILIGEVLAVPLWFLFPMPWKGALLLIVPMAYDGILQYGLSIMSNNRKRLFTGLLAGYGLITFYIHLFLQIADWAAGRI